MFLRLWALVLVFFTTACSFQVQKLSAQTNAGPTVDVTEDMIQSAVLLSERDILLKLTQAGRNKLAAITKEQLGNKIRIHVLGYEAISATVFHEINSGQLVIKDPSPDLEAELEPYIGER